MSIRQLQTERIRQIATFCAVGATGIPIDLAATTAAIHLSGMTVASQAVGWLLAVSWNYSWNSLKTWDAGRSIGGFLRYLGVDLSRFVLRACVVALALAAGISAIPATAVGIAVAVAVGFVGFDRLVFDG